MSDFTQALSILMNNPQTSWIGYAIVILVVFSLAMVMVSGFVVKFISNVKEGITATKAAVEELKAKPKEPTDYVKQIKNEANITPLLADIRHDTHADRVCVLQYHNGVHSIADNSLLKISMTHERLGLDVHSIMNAVQNWPANYLGKINDDIFDGRYIKHPTLESLKKCPDMRGIYEQIVASGVKSFYCFPMQNARGKIFGIGVIQYTNKEYDLEDRWIKWAQHRFTSIGALLAGLKDERKVDDKH